MKYKGKKVQEEPVNTGPGVSELLRTTRERAGLDLQTVAEVLRIRYVYLEAIEDGRYEDLPGKTYVVGFVRAYAEHLGLDSDEVVRRFKDEISGLQGKAELVFPSPVTEQSVPGGAIILISLIILGAAYGGWYFLSSQDRSVAELVPDLPAKFSEMVNRVKGSDDGEEKAEVVEEAPAEPVVVEEKPAEPVSEANTQDMAQAAREAVEKAEEKAEAETEEVAAVETVKVETVSEAVEEKVEEAAEAAEKTMEAVEETVAEAVEQATEAAEEAPAQEAVTEEVAEAVEAVEEKVEEPVVETPQVMTEKILLKAVDYSWVEVTDSAGAVIHTQVLNEGDEYQIPQQVGLILRTGNAGGLEILVDGEKVPSVGTAGEVRRRILMDPKKLIAGKAVEN